MIALYVLPVLVLLAVGVFYVAAALRGWRIGKLSWPFQNGAGACARCKTVWRFVVPHYTFYDVTRQGSRRAVRPLCERCWAELGAPEARYPYYADLMADWILALEAGENFDEALRLRQASSAVVAAVHAGL